MNTAIIFFDKYEYCYYKKYLLCPKIGAKHFWNTFTSQIQIWTYPFKQI